jgi:hypothetical protein
MIAKGVRALAMSARTSDWTYMVPPNPPPGTQPMLPQAMLPQAMLPQAIDCCGPQKTPPDTPQTGR